MENYPESAFYDAKNLIQNLGIGEALVTALDEKGIPTPLVHTYLISPQSRMNVLSETEIEQLIQHSALVKKYATTVDKESAYEILVERIERAERNAENQNTAPMPKRTSTKKEKSMMEEVFSSRAGRTFTTTIMREGAKAIMGMLGLGGRRRR